MRAAARNDLDVSSGWARAALSHRICTGIPRRRLGTLIEELAPAWLARQESRLAERRGHDRLRAAGAGPGHELPFTDRVIATLIILRFQLPHAALAVFYQVDRTTITRAVHQIRPLLAARGFAVPGQPALRTEGIEDLLRQYPDVAAEVDSGYQGLSRDFPAQVSAPPSKPGKNAAAGETARSEQQRHQQSSARICVEHTIAEPKQWRPLQRWTGRREYFQETALAIAGLVSDRAATR